MTLPEDNAATPRANLSARTLSGVGWTYGTTILGVIVQTAFTAAISRLLDDSVFGLIAVAQLSLRFGSYMTELGLGKALIQKPTLDDHEIRTGFTSATLLGLLVAAGAFALAPLLATVFKEPDVIRPLQAMSVTMVPLGAGMTANALAKRQMRFRELGLISLVSYIVGYPIVGIGLALSGAGVWSLVGAAIVQSTMQAMLTYVVVRHPTRPLLARQAVVRLYSYGGRVGLLGMLEFIGGDLDTFAIGRYAGTATLGQYNRAYMLLKLPLYHAINSLTSVVFPGMSTIQHDVRRLRGAYVSLAGILAALLFPLCAGAAVASRELALVVLGPQWETTADVLPVIAAALAVQFLTTPCGIVLEAMAELNRKLVVQVTYLVLLAGFMVLAAGGPDVGYAAALAAGGIVRHVVYVGVLHRVISLNIWDLVRRYLYAGAAAAAVAGTIAVVRSLVLGSGTPLSVVLLAEVTTGAVVALLCIRFGIFGPIVHDLVGRLRAAGAMPESGNRARIAVALLGRRAFAGRNV